MPRPPRGFDERRVAPEARDKLSGGKLRYVRPGDRNAPLERAPHIDESDNEDEDQGELFADDDAYDWDEAEDDG